MFKPPSDFKLPWSLFNKTNFIKGPLAPLQKYIMEFDGTPDIQELFRCVYVFVSFMEGKG